MDDQLERILLKEYDISWEYIQGLYRARGALSKWCFSALGFTLIVLVARPSQYQYQIESLTDYLLLALCIVFSILIGIASFIEMRLIGGYFSIRSIEKSINTHYGGTTMCLFSKHIAEVDKWEYGILTIIFRMPSLLLWSSGVFIYFCLLIYLFFYSNLGEWYFSLIFIILACMPLAALFTLFVGAQMLIKKYSTIESEKLETIKRMNEKRATC